MKKVLFYPGTFNPPHIGHVSTIEVSLRNIDFDEVWIMPSGKRVDKEVSVEYKHRKNMTDLLIKYLNNITNTPIKLIDSESEEHDGKYTHEIILDIKEKQGNEIYQLCGIDGFLSIKEREIDPSEKFVVIKRSGYESFDELIPRENLTILNEEVDGISSTKIREMIKSGDNNYKDLIPQEVAKYIEENRLYIE
jgi:nicotinate-nucleotide adenylyltransferase